MFIVPGFRTAGHPDVTSWARPAMLAGADKEETRTSFACRREGTGLEGASSMLPHAWPHAHCSAFSGIPVGPFWGNYHRYGQRPPRWAQDRGHGSHRNAERRGAR